MTNVIRFPIDPELVMQRRATALGEAVDAARVADGKTSISALKPGMPGFEEAEEDFLRMMLIELGEDPDDDSDETFMACLDRIAARTKRD